MTRAGPPPRGVRTPAALVALAAAMVAMTAAAYRDGPPPAHTGGFGEAHCGACHFDAPVDDGAGSIVLELPDAYRPGQSYDVVVALLHPDLEAAGFQLTARFAPGDRAWGQASDRAREQTGGPAGSQAGRLEPADQRTQVARETTGVAYASHTAAGTGPAGPGVGRWVVRWTAPAGCQDVVFHVAANAANDDDSEFGDRIYLAERRVPAGEACEKR